MLLEEEQPVSVEQGIDEVNQKIAECTSRRDFGMQVCTDDLQYSFISIIKTDATLMTLCGIRNFNILTELIRLVEKFYPVKKKRQLSTKEQIILVMMKLKLDLSLAVMHVFFNSISLATCREVFYEMLRKLSTILRATIQPVDPEEIANNMPHCFQDFQNTIIILDCTEIPVQKPKCLKCRIMMYSSYKSRHTIKFMTGVTPAGLLSFVSKSYGGRASDKVIFEQSNVINQLRSNKDAVMVDKGFHISDMCAQRRVELIRPPFLHQKFSEEEALRNRKIAAARVHVERMNQRIRLFSVLNNTLNWNLIPHINDIFIICCGLANLGTPIMEDDKFM